jgi:hypothetical protein
MMKNHLKPMGARDVLDSTFTIMRENFWSFQGVFFKSFLPALIILGAGIVGAVVYFLLLKARTNIPLTDPRFWSEMGNASIWAVIIGVILLFIMVIAFFIAIVIGGIYYTYGNFKIFKNGLHDQKTSSKEAFQGIKGNRARIFLVQFIIGILLYIVAIPGIIVTFIITLQWPLIGRIISYGNSLLQMFIGFFFCMALPTVVFGNLDVMKSIGRGFKLMSKHRWRIFWTLFLVNLLAIVIVVVFMGLVAIPIFLAVAIKNVFVYILAGIFGIVDILILVQLITYSYGTLTAIYYDLLIRKEGYDISIQLARDNSDSGADQNGSLAQPL